MLGAALTNRLLPGVAPAFSLTVDGAVTRSVHGRLGAFYAPERRRQSSAADFAVGLTALEVAGCYEAPRPLTPLACVGGQAGAIHTVVYRPVPHQPGERPWAAARVDAGIKASARSVVAELRGFVLMPLTRWEFTVDDTRLHQTGRAAPGFQFAFGVAFE